MYILLKQRRYFSKAKLYDSYLTKYFVNCCETEGIIIYS
jgi:hypothetical protein